MTTLEKEMLEAILKADRYDENQEAINAAEVARRWIKKAVEESNETHVDGFLQDFFIEHDNLILLPTEHK